MSRKRIAGLLCLALLAAVPTGCSRSYWRRNADSEAYGLIREKTQLDARWTPPRSDINPSPLSRLYDPTDPDYGALPPDDPAARRYMDRMSDCNRIRGTDYWDEIGTGTSIENPAWVASLPIAGKSGPDAAGAERETAKSAGKDAPNRETASKTTDGDEVASTAERQPFLERFAITHTLRSVFRRKVIPAGRATIATAEIPENAPILKPRYVVPPTLQTASVDAPSATTTKESKSADAPVVSKPDSQIVLASLTQDSDPPAPLPSRVPSEGADAAPVPLPAPAAEGEDGARPESEPESSERATPSSPPVVDLAAGNPALPTVEGLKLREAVAMSYLHSREYQFVIEDVFLAALDLAFDRFQFDVRFLGFGGGRPSAGLDYAATPDGPKSMTGSAAIGMSRLLPAGGQWAVELANETLWLFSDGPDESGTASTLTFSFVQPLLFAAGRKVVLEDLTQSERNLLYASRDLARFRREFFVDTVTGGQSGGYLGLMQQIQTIANQEDNIRRLEEQLTIAEENTLTGDALSRTQLLSQLLQQQNQLRSSRAQLQSQLDLFKFQLGLPPDLELNIDTKFLRPFQLISSELTALEDRVDDEYFALAQTVSPRAPDVEGLRRAVETLVPILDEIAEVAVPQVEEDFRRVQENMPQRLAALIDPVQDEPRLREYLARDAELFAAAREQHAAQVVAVEQLLAAIEEAGEVTDDVIARRATAIRELEQAEQAFEAATSDEDLAAKQIELEKASRRLDEEFAELQGLYLAAVEAEEKVERIVRGLQGIQVGLRTELIELNPFELPLTDAVGYALTNRVDLMNQRALVTDARRKVEVAANAMRGILDVRVEQEVSTRPIFNNDNPLDFRRTAGTFRAGVQFVAPLDQIAQRNDYRVSQITYQRVRRNYMEAEDTVKLDIRRSWRNLHVLRQNFEVARNAIRINAQQYDLAVERATGPSRRGSGGGGGSSGGGGGGGGGGSGSSGADQQGLNLLNALQRLLNSQNQLIGIWVDYEASRLNIYRDMGIMEIDAQGMWVEPFYQNDLTLPEGVDGAGLPGWIAPASDALPRNGENGPPAAIPPVLSSIDGVEQPGAGQSGRAAGLDPATIPPASEKHVRAPGVAPPRPSPSEAGHDRSRQPTFSPPGQRSADGNRTSPDDAASGDTGWRSADKPKA